MKRSIQVMVLIGLISGALSAQESPAISEILIDPVDAARSNRIVPVKVYIDPEQATKPLPVVLFSHGLGGSREGSSYLGKGWAKAGYVAVFVQHPGSDESVWKDAPMAERMSALKAAASVKAFGDRVKDIPFVIDQLEKWNADEAHDLGGKLELSKIGMSGHSFGAVTTQAMMGAAYGPRGLKLADPRLSAFVAMSPSMVKRKTPEDAFGHIEEPVLCMTGTKDGDPLADPGNRNPQAAVEDRRKVFAALPEGDAYELVFDEGNHFDFAERDLKGGVSRDGRFHPIIVELTTKFWDAYLKDDATATAWLKSEKVEADLDLKDADVWAAK